MRDITSRELVDQELARHKHSLWYALNESSDGIWEWNIPSNQIYASPKLKQMLGYGPDEPVEQVQFWRRSIHPDDRVRVFTLLKDHLKGNLIRYEAIYRLRNRAGHYLWVHDRGKVSESSSDGQPIQVVGMVQNVTHQINQQQRLQSQATRDELTGLLNRRVCQETLETARRQARITGEHFAVILIDLDHFKRVNDEHGHQAGDKVLSTFASQAQQLLREKDTMFRWGGEEFVILMRNLSVEHAVKAAETLRERIADLLVRLDSGALVNLTISAGIACYPHHSSHSDKLIQKADIAMYRAKARGRNCVELFSLLGES